MPRAARGGMNTKIFLPNKARHNEPNIMKPSPTPHPAIKNMLSKSACFLAVSLVATLIPLSGFAQEKSPKNDEIVELSPFIVQAEKDTGYLAENTLVGTRLRTPIADTPGALSVMTADLLDDLGATEFRDVLDFVPGTGEFRTSTEDPIGNGTKNPSQYMSRGFVTNTQTKDFFSTAVAADRYLTQQITFTRGPNALLFGIGNPGGIVAIQVNRARFAGNRGQLEFRYGDYDSKRVTFDQNLELVKNRLAIRADLLVERGHTYREPTEKNKDGIFLTTTYRPWRSTDVILSYEYGKRDDVVARPIAPFDGFSTWIANDMPLYDNFSDARPSTVFTDKTPFTRAENLYVNVLHQNSLMPYYTSRGHKINGLTYNSFVTTTGRIINGTTVAPAVGGGDSISSDFISVNPIDVLLKHFGGDQAKLETWLASLGTARAIPESFTSGPVVIPMETFLSGGLDRIKQTWNIPRLIIEQRIGKNLDVEIAANYERMKDYNITTLRGTDYSIRYDPNLYLPDGSPNPYAAIPYVSNENFATRTFYDTET